MLWEPKFIARRREREQRAKERQLQTEDEQRRAALDSRCNEIAVAIQRLYEAVDSQAHIFEAEKRSERRLDAIRQRRESRRFRIDLAAVIIAGAALVLLAIQDGFLWLAHFDTLHALSQADRNSNIASQDNARMEDVASSAAGEAKIAADAAVKSAEAANASAQAESGMVKVTEAGIVPRFEATLLHMSGLKSPPTSGYVMADFDWKFDNLSVATAAMKKMAITFDVYEKLPAVVSYDKLQWTPLFVSTEGGRSITSAAQSVFKIPTAKIDEFLDGKHIGIIYGFLDFLDAIGRPHRQCFGYEMENKGGDETTGYYPARSAAFTCRK